MRYSKMGNWISLALLIIVGMGCGGGDGIKRVKVTGTVTADSEPFANGQIFFTPKNAKDKILGGGAVTDESGAFTVKHAKGQNGIEPGEYIVFFSKFMMPDGSEPPEAEEGDDSQVWERGAVQFVPPDYNSAISTQNIVSVGDSGETLEFSIPKLEPQAKKPGAQPAARPRGVK